MHGLRSVRADDDESPRARLTDCTCGRAESLTEEGLARILRQYVRAHGGGGFGTIDELHEHVEDIRRLVAEVRRLREENAEWGRAHHVASESVHFMRSTHQDKAVVVLADVIRTLRIACEELGDNDWPADLHPSDVIEKHLLNYVRERIPPD